MGKENALPALITGLALIVYVVVTVNVGRARGKYNVPAPQISGNPDFERVLRVQQNTLEQIVLFLPSLWLFALLTSPVGAAALGGLWIVGRIAYAVGYYAAAEKRGTGFLVTVLASSLLLLGGLFGAAKALLSG